MNGEEFLDFLVEVNKFVHSHEAEFLTRFAGAYGALVLLDFHMSSLTCLVRMGTMYGTDKVEVSVGTIVLLDWMHELKEKTNDRRNRNN